MLRMTILKVTSISFSFVPPLSSFPVLNFLLLCFTSYLLNTILSEENSMFSSTKGENKEKGP